MAEPQERRSRRMVQSEIIDVCKQIDPEGKELDVVQRLYPDPSEIEVTYKGSTLSHATWVETLASLKMLHSLVEGQRRIEARKNAGG